MTKIEWTDETWNPVTGCDKISQGCKNCYAEKMHKRLMGMFPKKYSKPFLGNIELHVEEVYAPLFWKKPRMVFVNSMSDLLHKDVPFCFIDACFDAMEAAHWHTFQILTKRAERLLEFYQWKAAGNGFKFTTWPLRNVWIGVSCEDQKAANERIPFLLQVPAEVRFLSCEPLLGPINPLVQVIYQGAPLSDQKVKDMWEKFPFNENRIDWVIAGGESGHNARPMHPDWIRSLRDLCDFGNIPFFFKQWGEWEPDSHVSFNGPFFIRSTKHYVIDIYGRGHLYRDMFDWDEDANKREQELNITKQSNAWWMANTGKSKSGNVLDGKQHLEFPSTSNQ